ncbi:MAG: hypothetical protein WBW11_01500, partial [Pseudolabrys sp.]
LKPFVAIATAATIAGLFIVSLGPGRCRREPASPGHCRRHAGVQATTLALPQLHWDGFRQSKFPADRDRPPHPVALTHLSLRR